MSDDISLDDPITPLKRIGHVAAPYRNCMLVWGGYKEAYEEGISRYLPGDELWAYDPLTEKWLMKGCQGVHPPGSSGSVALVCNDNFYVFGGYQDTRNSNSLYNLDMKTLVWSRISTSGTPPVPSDKLVAWTYDNKLYFFGGFSTVPEAKTYFKDTFDFSLDTSTPLYYRRGWNNQLVCFDPETNEWSWPLCKGPIPIPRAAHSATIQYKRFAYVFGGRNQRTRMNDLHCLDMETLTWSGNLTKQEICPDGRSWHTLTALNELYIVLYGGFNQKQQPLNDCWLFDTHNQRWQEFRLSFEKPRLWHTAILSSYNEVVIYGGCTENILDHSIVPDHTSDIFTLRFSPKSLFRICLEATEGFMFSHSLDIHQLPIHIRKILIKRNHLRNQTTFGGS